MYVAILLSSCAQSTKVELSDEEILELTAWGDSISTHAQHVLLQHVAGAMAAGGVEHAIAFCNTRAIPLTDSVANHYVAAIDRLSDRNRNHNNGIKNKSDQLVWNKIAESEKSFVESDKYGDIYYYKPIFIAMPTCLRCHGKKEVEENTLMALQQSYPEDKALGYAMGDLWGMWKIRLSQNR